MKLKNNKIRNLYHGLLNLSVDVQTGQQRKLPLLAGVRVRRTLKDLEDSEKVLSEAIQEKQKVLTEKFTELREQVKAEKITKEQFNDHAMNLQNNANREVEELLNEAMDVQFSGLVTMDDIARIDATLEEGAPSGVAEAILILEELQDS